MVAIMWRRISCVGLLVGISLASIHVDAAPIAYEPFDYPTGPIAGRNGGTGMTPAWIGNGAVSPGSLSYSGGMLPTIGNHFTTAALSSGASRFLNTVTAPPGTIDGGRFGANGATIYVSFLARLASGSNDGYGGLSLFDNLTERLFFGDPGFDTFFRWGVDSHDGPPQTRIKESGVLVDGTTRLLVGRIDFAAGPETVRFYLDPPIGSEPGTPTIGPFTMPDFRFNRIRLESGRLNGTGGTHAFDEIRFGTTYADVVVPEPSTWMLLSCGLAGSFLAALSHKRASRRDAAT